MARIIKTTKKETILFEEAKVGDYFEFENNLCMKITRVGNDHFCTNAVCLNNGEAMAFDYDDKIIPLNNSDVIIDYKV